MEKLNEKSQKPNDYDIKLDHLKHIKAVDSARFESAARWIQLMIDDPQHPDRLKLFSKWTEEDLKSLLSDIFE